MTLRARLALASALIAALGAWLVLDEVLDHIRTRQQEAMELVLVDVARLLAAQIACQPADAPAARLDHFFAEARAAPVAARIYEVTKVDFDLEATLTDATGIVVWDSADPAAVGRDHGRWNDVLRTLRGGYGARATRADPADPDTAVLHVAAPVRRDGILTGVLSVRTPVRSAVPFERTARESLLLFGTLIAGGVALLAALVTAWFTAPLARLRGWAHAMARGERRPPPRLGRSEIGAVADDLARMASELDGRAALERQVQALVHEVKGPLTSLQAAAELLAGDDGAIAPDDRHRLLANLQAETTRLQTLIEAMLHLAALERRDGAGERRPVALGDLARAAAADAEAVCRRRGLTVAIDDPADLHVTGEPFLLGLALGNLLRNALDFSPDGGRIAIRIADDDGAALIAISDQGPGVPDWALARLGERFFSLPRPGDGRRSSGLGLAIVREIAARHGGTVVLANRPEGGAEARLRLPLG